MTNINVDFKTGKVIELAFATIIEGKEDQFFGEYFPRVMPIASELGGQPLGSYSVIESRSQLDDPKMGAFFQWDSIDAFEQLHNDPRFLDIALLRDTALSSFTNALFYSVEQDTTVNFEEGEVYALIAHLEEYECCMSAPLLELTPASDLKNQEYAPINIQLFKWSKCCDTILQEGKADIFKFTFNLPH